MIEIPVPMSLWLDLVDHPSLQSLKAWRESHVRAADWHPAKLEHGIYHDHRKLLEGMVGEWALNYWWFDEDERPFWERADRMAQDTQGDRGSDLADGSMVNVKTTRQVVEDANPLEFHLFIPQHEMKRGNIHVLCLLTSDRLTARLMGWTRSWDWAGAAMHYTKRGLICAHVPAWKLHPMDTLRACL